MAKTTFTDPIERISGKIKKQSNVSFRGNHTYCLVHPRGEKDFSEHEKAYRRHFGAMNQEASRINKDPARAGEFQDWKEKGYGSRYRYILALLVHDDGSRFTMHNAR